MRTCCLCLILFFVASAAAAQDLRVIANRADDGIELYLGMRASDMPALLGHSASWMSDSNGHVDITPFRKGTFDQADTVFSNVQTTLDDTAVQFEAMSLMVHTDTLIPPFDTPVDAMVAMAVCTAPESDVPLHLDTLSTYAGYYAYKVDGLANLTLTFPHTGRSAIEVSIRSFYDGDWVADETAVLTDGGSLALPGVHPNVLSRISGLIQGLF